MKVVIYTKIHDKYMYANLFPSKLYSRKFRILQFLVRADAHGGNLRLMTDSYMQLQAYSLELCNLY